MTMWIVLGIAVFLAAWIVALVRDIRRSRREEPWRRSEFEIF